MNVEIYTGGEIAGTCPIRPTAVPRMRWISAITTPV